MSEWRLTHIAEPALAFGFGQTAEHPKDGLFLYGPPASNQNPARMDVGVIGTADGIDRYARWVKSIGLRIGVPEKGREGNKMMWPGFEAVFGIRQEAGLAGNCNHHVGSVRVSLDGGLYTSAGNLPWP